MSFHATSRPLRLPVIREHMKIIRNLAAHGRNLYHKYLIIPLSAWSVVKPGEALSFYLDALNMSDQKKDASVRAAAYKRAIIRSVAHDQFDLTLAGTLCRDFMREMCEWSELAYTAEAGQLFSLLAKPFAEFSKYESEKLTDKFEKQIEADENERELFEMLERMQRKNEEALAQLRQKSRLRLKEIAASAKTAGEQIVKRDIVSFLLMYSTADEPDLHRIVAPLIEAFDKKRPGFSDEVNDSVAVVIYREIMNAIQKNDLRKALALISKYTVIFRGNPSTRYYFEVDAFEKRLFEIIEKKDLWFSV